MTFSGLRMAINYGLNRVRFVRRPAARACARAARHADAGKSVQVTWAVTVEREGADKPCCVAEWIVGTTRP